MYMYALYMYVLYVSVIVCMSDIIAFTNIRQLVVVE